MTFLFLANSTLTSSNPFLSLISSVEYNFIFFSCLLCVQRLFVLISFSSSHVLSTSHDQLQLHFYFSFYSQCLLSLPQVFSRCRNLSGLYLPHLIVLFSFPFWGGGLLLLTTMTNTFATAGSLQNSLQAYWLTSFFVWRKCCHSVPSILDAFYFIFIFPLTYSL